MNNRDQKRSISELVFSYFNRIAFVLFYNFTQHQRNMANCMNNITNLGVFCPIVVNNVLYFYSQSQSSEQLAIYI